MKIELALEKGKGKAQIVDGWYLDTTGDEPRIVDTDGLGGPVSNWMVLELKLFFSACWHPYPEEEKCVCKTVKPGDAILVNSIVKADCVRCGERVSSTIYAVPARLIKAALEEEKEERCEACELRKEFLDASIHPGIRNTLRFLTDKEHTCKKEG